MLLWVWFELVTFWHRMSSNGFAQMNFGQWNERNRWNSISLRDKKLKKYINSIKMSVPFISLAKILFTSLPTNVAILYANRRVVSMHCCKSIGFWTDLLWLNLVSLESIVSKNVLDKLLLIRCKIIVWIHSFLLYIQI